MKPKYMTGIAVSRRCLCAGACGRDRCTGRRFGCGGIGRSVCQRLSLNLGRWSRCHGRYRIGRSGSRSRRLYLITLRFLLDDAQIEYRVAAVAQVGEKVFQHVSVRTASLQIHQHTGVWSRIDSTSSRPSISEAATCCRSISQAMPSAWCSISEAGIFPSFTR